MELDLKAYIASPKPRQLMMGVLKESNKTEHADVLFAYIEFVFKGQLSVDDFTRVVLDNLDPDGNDEDLVGVVYDVYEEVLADYDDVLREVFNEKRVQFDDMIISLLEKFSLTFDDPRLKQRFERLCMLYVKGEYDYARLLRAFSKDIKVGGLALDEDVALKLSDDLNGFVGRVVFDDVLEEGDVVGEVASSGVSGDEDEIVSSQVSRGDSKTDSLQASGGDEIVSSQVSGDDSKTASSQSPRNDSENISTVVEKKSVDVPRKKTVGRRMVTSRRSVDDVDLQVPHETVKEIGDYKDNDLLAKDENEEVKRQLKKHEMSQRVDVALEARKIIAEFGMKFRDEMLEKRLHQVVVARLKEVRGPYETRDVVMKPVDQGGLGMAVDQAQKFLRHVENANDVLVEKWRVQKKKEKDRYVQERRKVLFENKNDVSVVAAPGKSVDIVGLVQQVPVKQRAAVVAEHLKTLRPKINDVQAAQQLKNPISELSSYTIEDWHRLHSDPHEAALKIEGKVGLLRDESFTSMKKGVAAWQLSEVMRVYKEQLQQSVVGGLSLEEVIKKRTEAGLPVLSAQEVAVLTQLNARLRR